jgi:hypothetical protein
MHLVALDELLRFRLRAGRVAAGVGDDELDLAAGDGVVVLLEKELDALLHLLAAGGERARAHAQEPDADRFALRLSEKRRQQRAAKRECSKHFVLLLWRQRLARIKSAA